MFLLFFVAVKIDSNLSIFSLMNNNILKIYSFTSVYIKKKHARRKTLGRQKEKQNTCSEQDMGERGRLHQILLPPI